MPPEQTNLASESGRDAAGLHLAAAIEDATGNAVAGARPDASIAALRDAFSEKEAVGPPVTPTSSVLSLLQEYWRAFRKWCLQQRPPAGLHDLSDRHLKDIGLPPGDIDCIVARRAMERFRDGATYL